MVLEFVSIGNREREREMTLRGYDLTYISNARMTRACTAMTPAKPHSFPENRFAIIYTVRDK